MSKTDRIIAYLRGHERGLQTFYYQEGQPHFDTEHQWFEYLCHSNYYTSRELVYELANSLVSDALTQDQRARALLKLMKHLLAEHRQTKTVKEDVQTPTFFSVFTEFDYIISQSAIIRDDYKYPVFVDFDLVKANLRKNLLLAGLIEPQNRVERRYIHDANQRKLNLQRVHHATISISLEPFEVAQTFETYHPIECFATPILIETPILSVHVASQDETPSVVLETTHQCELVKFRRTQVVEDKHQRRECLSTQVSSSAPREDRKRRLPVTFSTILTTHDTPQVSKRTKSGHQDSTVEADLLRSLVFIHACSVTEHACTYEGEAKQPSLSEVLSWIP